mmetsp:Transcript_2183/g.3200  ORF Transcript_2183/g.3200 Transcript_2183/m.3200 type:complete len:344 (-) Transcript_2183:83-1114(-)
MTDIVWLCDSTLCSFFKDLAYQSGKCFFLLSVDTISCFSFIIIESLKMPIIVNQPAASQEGYHHTFLALQVMKEGFMSSDVLFYLNVAKATYDLKSRMSDRQCQCIAYYSISDVMFSCSRFFIVNAEESNKIIVAFRGTLNMKELLNSFKFVPKAVGDRHIHCGVFREGQKMLQKHGLMKEVDSAIRLHPDSQVVFVGHSFGGGLASYLAWHINRQRQELAISVYTFGSLPCTSNPDITEGRQNLSILNFVNKLDPIPRASWERMSGAFRDDSKRNRKDFRRPMHMFGKTVMLQDDIKLGGFFDCFHKEGSWSNHSIDSYSKALENCFSNAQTKDKESCEVKA